MRENGWKAILTTVAARLSIYFKMMAVPLAVLLGVMVLDYITGVAAAWMNSELNSRTGIRGILKKLGYMMVVCVGMCADWLIYQCFHQMGMELEYGFWFGMIVTVWLILNELISILENTAKLGTPLPTFLTALLSKLKNSVEQKGDGK